MKQLVAAVVMLGVAACGEGSVNVGGHGTGGGTGSNSGGGSDAGAGGGSGAGSGTGGGAPSWDAGPPCVGLCQQVAACPSGSDTTLEGIVYDPAGKVPLYNVAVFVPNDPLDPITEGTSCERCAGQLSGNPLTHDLTNSHGHFTLTGVPAGDNIPLVIQVGKWRREVKVPHVASCVTTTLTDKNLTRLPRNRNEGHIPQIAITTGGADTLECLPRRMGIDASEFGVAGSPARIHLYAGQPGAGSFYVNATDRFAGGATFTDATALWGTQASLKKYDMVMLSCEGDEYANTKPQSALAAMDAFGKQGGRIFATHFHEYFFRAGPAPWPSAGHWVDPVIGSNYSDDVQHTATLNGSFPKGASLIEWMKNVGASTTGTTMKVSQVRYTLSSVAPAHGQDWARVKDFALGEAQPDAILYATFNTPLGAPEDQQCGRSVYSGLHVAAATPTGQTADSTGTDFPNGCVLRDLSPQEKAMEFMLFDLSSCVQSDSKPPAIN